MHAIVLADDPSGAALALAVRSFREHHPGSAVTVVQCDPLAALPTIAGARAIAARDLAIGGMRYIDLRLAAGPDFARWAVIPAAVAAVMPSEPALVIPSSAWVRANLDDLADGVGPDEVCLLPRFVDVASGISSGGWLPDTVVVGSAKADALEWWQRRAVEVVVDLDDRLGVELADPWIAFANDGSDLRRIDDPTIRVAPASVAGLDPVPESARLAQFPHFDPDRPWWYSTAPDLDPPVLTSDNLALRDLCGGYAAALGRPRTGHAADRTRRTTPEAVGVRLTPTLRAEFRRLLVTALEAGDPPPPNLFEPDETASFMAWLRGPGTHDGSGISVAADLILADRPDLVAAFPNVRWSGRDAFVRWLWTFGLSEGLITTALLPPMTAAPDEPGGESAERRFGVNLVGYHDSELGLGVAVRRVAAALDAARIPWTKLTYDRTHSRRRAATANRSDAPYWFNLILIAPDQLRFFVDDVGAEFMAGHHNIGLWYWETDVLNPRQAAALDLVDEIWGATRYLVDVFAAHTSKPVVHVPVPLEFQHTGADPATRTRLGLDERFTFLFTFDFFSIAERKNPLGLVEAYRRAFDADDGVRLIMKAINGGRSLDASEEIRAAIADRPDIELWDRYLTAEDRLALVANADCYVSLHRSEGLGLTMAEAMAAGTPVIASGYSGNLDFMPPGAALLVDCTEVEIGPGSFYPAHGHWAEPDVDHAAELMRRVREDGTLRRELSAGGPKALRPFTVKRVGAQVAERLHGLWQPGQ